MATVESPTGPAGNGTTGQPLLRLTRVSKSYGPVQALTEVDLEVHPGEVVALVGDNGAGKSTLIKTVSGVGPASGGEIEWDGQVVQVNAPQDSASLGIAVVYQDLALCDNLDIVANLFLGREEHRGPKVGPLDEIGMEHRAQELLDSLAVKLRKSIRSEVGALSGGQRQSVAIARALLGEPRLVILDEPTAALGVAQTEQVLALVKRLRERGLGVILISHNLADVFEVADRIVVLRLGRNNGEYPAVASAHEKVVAAITGVGGDHQPADAGADEEATP